MKSRDDRVSFSSALYLYALGYLVAWLKGCLRIFWRGMGGIGALVE